MAVNKKITSNHAKMWIGQPVCTVLQDGSYYVGTVKAVKNGKLVLAGIKGNGRTSTSTGPSRAQVSGFLGSMLGGNAGGAAAAPGAGAEAAENAAAASNGAGFGGMMKTISLGINMIQMIMPLLQLFRV